MAVKHTEGRISVEAQGEANQYALLDDDGNWWMSVLVNGQQPTPLQAENLRRLVACWNAFGGYSTQAIEALVEDFEEGSAA